MTTWGRVIGDSNDTIVMELEGVSDLSGISAIEAHVWKFDVVAATLTAAVTDSANRIVTVSLGSWIATAAAGTYSLEVQTTAAGVVRTWPERTPDQIEVRAQGA